MGVFLDFGRLVGSKNNVFVHALRASRGTTSMLGGSFCCFGGLTFKSLERKV